MAVTLYMATNSTVRESDLDLRLEEKALVRRLLSGDEAAMEELADGYFPGLYRFAVARLRGDSDLARDIVQTTACKALAKLETYRGEAPLFTWLCACCRNEILMHFRRKDRWPDVVAFDEDDSGAEVVIQEPGDQPEEALARKQEARRVHTALDLLPPRYARALEWKYLDRLQVEEIAGRLRVGAKAAESLLSRARRAFRERYQSLKERKS